MAKHTPGPWRVTLCWSQTCGLNYVIQNRNAPGNEDEVALANAQLMEAAPELLIACEKALEDLGKNSSHVADLLEMVIAKARKAVSNG